MILQSVAAVDPLVALLRHALAHEDWSGALLRPAAHLLLAATALTPTRALWGAFQAVDGLDSSDDPARIQAALGHFERFWRYMDDFFRVCLVGFAVLALLILAPVLALWASWAR